jgi:hypothetical protein
LSTALVKGQNMSLATRQLRVTVQIAHAADLSALLVTARSAPTPTSSSSTSRTAPA